VGTPRTPFARHVGPGAIGKVIEKCTQKYPGKRYKKIKELRADLLAALQDGATKAYSQADQKVLELLSDWGNLSDDDLDYIFLRLDDLADNKKFSSEIILAFKETFIKAIAPEHPEYIASFCKHLLEFNLANEGGFIFAYCDVLCDKMLEVFPVADLGGQAELLLGLLVLGTRHNRWYVERSFCQRANAAADAALIDRLIAEAEARQINLKPYLEHLLVSITVDEQGLHPQLRELVA
jgi:hypothetical protein